MYQTQLHTTWSVLIVTQVKQNSKNLVDTGSKRLLFLADKFTCIMTLTKKLSFNCLVYCIKKDQDSVTQGISSVHFTHLLHLLRSSQPWCNPPSSEFNLHSCSTKATYRQRWTLPQNPILKLNLLVPCHSGVTGFPERLDGYINMTQIQIRDRAAGIG